MAYSDETLMAYADGELAPDLAARIGEAERNDPEIAARIRIFVRSREAVAHAMAAPDADGAPDPMLALIRKLDQQSREKPAQETRPIDNVVQLGKRRTVPLWLLPVAASVALAIGLAFGVQRSGPTGIGTADLAIAPGQDLAAALATVPSGERRSLALGEIEVIASFLTDDGAFCREFELDGRDGRTLVSVACQTDAVWDLKLAIVAASDSTGYAPASSLATLDAWLEASAATAPMSAEAEAARLAEIR